MVYGKRLDSAKDGAVFGTTMIGVGGALGALSGWAGGQAGAGTTASMLGMERYGKGFSEKIANSSIGKRLAGV